MEKIFIIPAPGKKVRKPDSKLHLPEKGEFVVKNSFWNRRIKEGDVVLKEEVKKEEKLEKLPAKQGDKQ